MTALNSDKRLQLSAVELQQEYYETIGDADWELYEKKDRRFLLQKVAVALCGPPTIEGNLMDNTNDDDELKLQGYEALDEDTCMNVFNRILEQVKGCKVFIDHDGREYQSWDDYLTNNKLPKCVMVVPRNGEYSGTIVGVVLKLIEGEMAKVNLTVRGSPELGTKAQVINTADNISTAPVMVGTAVGVATVSGIYSIGRSIGTLVDRSQHNQSIGLDNMEARSNWINIMISTVGLSFTAAGKLLTWAATTGRNVKILMSALDFLRFTNIATGFIGVANGLGDMIYKFSRYGKTPSTLEVFQVTTSFLFLGIGVMSNQTANEIVQDAQANKINEIRDSLSSNNKRRIFDKITAETRRLKGTIDGNTDVIKALKTINNKDEFFGKLKYMNKAFNKNKVRISLSSDGKVIINNQHKVSLSKIYKIGPNARDQLLAKYGPAKITSKNAPTRIYPSYVVASSSNVPTSELAYTIRPEEILKISAFILNLSKADEEFILNLLSLISQDLHQAFLLLCTEMISLLIRTEIEFLEAIFPDWKRRLVLFIYYHLSSKITVKENDNVFMAALKLYIRDGRINKETLLALKKEILGYFMDHSKQEHNKTWRDVDEYMKTYFGNLKTLKVGQELEIGPHKILVKQITVDHLEMGLAKYSQQQCDIFMDLCLKIISILSKDEVRQLNNVNPDEDIIMRVSIFLLERFNEYIGQRLEIDDSTLATATSDLLAVSNRQHGWSSVARDNTNPGFVLCECDVNSYYSSSVMAIHEPIQFHVGHEYRVIITHFTNPKNIYVRSDTYRDITAIETPGEDAVHTPVNNQRIIYKSKIVGKLVRGRICHISEEANPTCDIFAIDYGCMDTGVKIKDIYPLNLKGPDVNCPGLAIQCQLHLCEPKEDDFESDIQEKMKIFFGDAPAMMHVVNKTKDALVVEIMPLGSAYDMSQLLVLYDLTVFSKPKKVNKAYSSTKGKVTLVLNYKSKKFCVGDILFGKVVSIDSLTNFYFCEISDSDQSNEKINLSAYCKDKSANHLNMNIGEPCAVEMDGNCYERAIIRSVNSKEHTATLFLVDKGTEIESKFSRLKPVLDKEYYDVPMLAIHCSTTDEEVNGLPLKDFLSDSMKSQLKLTIVIRELGEFPLKPNIVKILRVEK
ncbi:hypothetical protein SFRURICE_014560 [Spodoptera frugiperda]|nr:hypothetical protein SFRURICE_014560 [Spodoptera frugiperda]